MSAQPQAPTTAEKDFRALLKARNTLFWVVSSEERRVEMAIAAAAAREGYHVRFWDCASGARSLTGEPIDLKTGIPDTMPQAVLAYVRGSQRTEAELWVLRDVHDWLGDPMVTRGLRSAARELQEEQQPSRLAAIVCLSPSPEVPLTLRSAATVIDWPLPTREELGRILDDVLAAAPESARQITGGRDQVVDAAAGLAAEEVASALALSIVRERRIEPSIVAAEKKRAIDRERVLTWYPPDPRGLAGVGGLSRLKRWLEQRKLALTPEARAYHLPAPKGVLLVGIPGNGKSLVAKSVPSAWGIPLLRLDLGALKGSLVGQSEANVRRALKIAEAVAPVVLWIDEIEKAMAGASSGYGGDGGVSADQLGTVLTWLQERAGLVFVVATANNVASLPPELSRKGRFDEVFFVDLPTAAERAEILASALTAHHRDPKRFDLTAVAAKTSEFSGAEVAELVPAGLFRSFADGGRELAVEDLLAAAEQTVPVARSAAEQIAALRKWAETRAVRASDPEPESRGAVGGFGRRLILEGGKP